MEERLTDSLLILAKLIHKNIHPVLNDVRMDLTHLEFKTLMFLKEKNVSMKDLTKKLHISKQQLTKIIETLVNKDYVTRIINKNDRRYINLSITEKGLFFLEESYEKASHAFIEKFSCLTDKEIQHFIDSIEEINSTFNKISV